MKKKLKHVMEKVNILLANVNISLWQIKFTMAK